MITAKLHRNNVFGIKYPHTMNNLRFSRFPCFSKEYCQVCLLKLLVVGGFWSGQVFRQTYYLQI